MSTLLELFAYQEARFKPFPWLLLTAVVTSFGHLDTQRFAMGFLVNIFGMLFFRLLDDYKCRHIDLKNKGRTFPIQKPRPLLNFAGSLFLASVVVVFGWPTGAVALAAVALILVTYRFAGESALPFVSLIKYPVLVTLPSLPGTPTLVSLVSGVLLAVAILGIDLYQERTLS
jgi:hypothetical protein